MCYRIVKKNGFNIFFQGHCRYNKKVLENILSSADLEDFRIRWEIDLELRLFCQTADLIVYENVPHSVYLSQITPVTDCFH